MAVIHRTHPKRMKVGDKLFTVQGKKCTVEFIVEVAGQFEWIVQHVDGSVESFSYDSHDYGNDEELPRLFRQNPVKRIRKKKK